MAKTTRIRTLRPHDNGTAPLSLNGQEFELKLGVPCDVPDLFLPLLDDSNIQYELVSAKASAEGAEGAGGIAGEPAPEAPPEEKGEAQAAPEAEQPKASKAKAPKRKAAKGKPAKAAAKPANPAPAAAKPPGGMTTMASVRGDRLA